MWWDINSRSLSPPSPTLLELQGSFRRSHENMKSQVLKPPSETLQEEQVFPILAERALRLETSVWGSLGSLVSDLREGLRYEGPPGE